MTKMLEAFMTRSHQNFSCSLEASALQKSLLLFDSAMLFAVISVGTSFEVDVALRPALLLCRVEMVSAFDDFSVVLCYSTYRQ